LFALVFAFAHGRIGSLPPRATAALLAVAAFVSLVLVPGLKYPANPPAVGDPGTIGSRTALFFTMIVISVAALILRSVSRKASPDVTEAGTRDLLARLPTRPSSRLRDTRYRMSTRCPSISLPSCCGIFASLRWAFMPCFGRSSGGCLASWQNACLDTNRAGSFFILESRANLLTYVVPPAN
jgi:hypothetical protein